jgi:hypothetical protein
VGLGGGGDCSIFIDRRGDKCGVVVVGGKHSSIFIDDGPASGSFDRSIQTLVGGFKIPGRHVAEPFSTTSLPISFSFPLLLFSPSFS